MPASVRGVLVEASTGVGRTGAVLRFGCEEDQAMNILSSFEVPLSFMGSSKELIVV